MNEIILFYSSFFSIADFIDRINEGFNRRSYNIGICTKPIENSIVVFNLHVNFPNIVASFVNGLYQEFL